MAAMSASQAIAVFNYCMTNSNEQSQLYPITGNFICFPYELPSGSALWDCEMHNMIDEISDF